MRVATAPEIPPGSSGLALRFRRVSKRHPEQAVLDGFDLQVRQDECFALVGLNGAGKTTCIKSLLYFDEIDEGSISIFGVDHRVRTARSRLAYLPESFVPPYHHTGRQFLAYATRLYGERWEAAELEGLCRAFDLAPAALARPVRTLSKGMAQKLGLVGCLASRRELLVLDEPMTGLDPRARVFVKRHLRTLRETGRTVFFSTHMLFDVQEICDRMGVLHRGRLHFVGTPAECCRRFGASNLEEAFLACIEAPKGAAPGRCG